MNDAVISLAMVGRLLRHRWPLFVLVAVLGAGLGFGSSYVLAPGYVATGKILLQGERDEKSLPGEVQIATSLVVLNKTADALGWGQTGSDLQSTVSASVDGNVVSISGAAPTPQRAQQLAQKAMDEYIAFSGQIVSDTAAATAEVSKQNQDTVQKRIDDANKRITDLQASPTINAAGADGDAARSELEQEKAVVTSGSKDLEKIDSDTESASLAASLGRSTTRVIETPSAPESPASPTIPELIAAGAVIAIVLVAFAHLVALRADRRLRDPEDIAAAIGAPVLGQFDVDDPAGRRSLVSRVRRDDRRWTHPDTDVTEDDRSRLARGERVLRRLMGGAAGPAEVLVLSFADDDAARAALPGLAVSAAHSGRVTVVTADEELAAAVREVAAHENVSALVGVDAANGVAGTTVLRSVTVSSTRPVVPDLGTDPLVLLMMTPGTRTGWDLTALAAACADIGRLPEGCVLVNRCAPGRKPSAASSTSGGKALDDAALAGSS